MKKNRLKRYLARVEFIENRSIIYEMIEKGYPFKSIHETLLEKGLTTMAYSTFVYLCRKDEKNELVPAIDVKKKIGDIS